MKILVLVKWVPEGINVSFKNDMTVNREQADIRMLCNPFDLYGMEAAARIKDQKADIEIVALTLGARGAESALKDCIAVGADRAYLISDPLYAGADTMLTAEILERAIHYLAGKEGDFDVIFAGCKTTDGGNTAIPSMLGERLHIPQLSFALCCELRGKTLRVVKERDEGNEIYEMQLPCLVSFTKADFLPRYPDIMRIIDAASQSLPRFGEAELKIFDGREKKSSRIKLLSVQHRDLGKQSLILQERDPAVSAGKLAKMLSAAHVI